MEPADIAIFETHQADPVASEMAAFPSRSAEAHAAHWQKVLADSSNVTRTILADGVVAGNIGGWLDEDVRHVGYWIAREMWGKGVATRALAAFVQLLDDRPLHAYVAASNRGSIRVLERCGFRLAEHEPSQRPASTQLPQVEEYLYVLEG